MHSNFGLPSLPPVIVMTLRDDPAVFTLLQEKRSDFLSSEVPHCHGANMSKARLKIQIHFLWSLGSKQLNQIDWGSIYCMKPKLVLEQALFQVLGISSIGPFQKSGQHCRRVSPGPVVFKRNRSAQKGQAIQFTFFAA